MAKDSINLKSSNVRWNGERGYYVISGPLINDQINEVTLWPSDLRRLSQWEKERDLPHLIYYRPRNRDHIVQDGDTLCHHDVRIPEPESDDLKPVSEVTEREWRLLTTNASDMCSHCQRHLSELEAYPENIPDGIPDFNCPECGESASKIGNSYVGGMVHHADGTTHEFDFSIYQQWRRGEDNEE